MQFTDDIFVQYEGFTGWLVGCTVPSGLNQASQGQRSNSNKKRKTDVMVHSYDQRPRQWSETTTIKL